MDNLTDIEKAVRLRQKGRVSRWSLPAASGFFAMAIALGVSACGGDNGTPLSPTPLAAPSRLSAEATALSPLLSPLTIAIAAVAPSSGLTSGGTPITLTGDDFAEGAIVLFGDLPALDVVVLSSTAITAITPAHAEGPVDVVVINPDGESSAVVGSYTYTDEPSVAPMIEAVSPSWGPATGGMEIVISGSNFAEGATVTLGAGPATNIVVLGDTTITAITPPHEKGPADVTVINPDGQIGILPGAYTYVADQSPSDLVVTITPSGVTPKELQVPIGSRVTFVNNNSRPHDMESDPHPIHTDCPAINEVGFIGPGESKQTGVFAVERTCGYHDHNQSTSQAFRGTITSGPLGAPTVMEASPPSGPTAGGTEIVISGSNFAEWATVSLGDWAATNVVVLDNTTITAITPPHEEGPVDVTVINPDGQIGTLSGAYTYLADQSPPDLVVTITPSGVTPKELQVPIGSRVTFVNNNSRPHDMESDPHPIHTDCPAINEVGFIGPGESKQTGAFAVARTCGYHDHNQSSNQALRGTIVVVPASVSGGVR